MRERLEPEISKWPFFVGDALLLGVAWFVYAQGQHPMGLRELTLMACCVAAGALAGMLPYLLEYRAALRVAEAGALTSVVSQIGDLTKIGEQIAGVTGRWQVAQEAADKTVDAARGIAERMSGEVQGFKEFMRGANETEKANLRLEVEKLRRAEQDWLQVLVRMMDHVFALHQAAVRSGQATVMEQVGRFQGACREAARRIGLTPFVAAPDEPFNSQKHQVLDGEAEPPSDAKVAETVATGYTFQGRLLRPVLVRLHSESEPAEPPPDDAGAPEQQNELPLPAQPERQPG